MTTFSRRNCVRLLLKFLLFSPFLMFVPAQAADLPGVRITQAIINEKSLALWIGVEQGFFRKHGVNVEIIQTRSSAQTLAALASGDIQIGGTTPSVVLSAAVGGMDVAFFAGIVNRADGDFMVAPGIRTAEDLKGKRLGVQSLGGGVWSLAMLALDHLGLEPTRDKILVIAVGDQSVLAQAMLTGRIDATYLGYTYSALLKDKGFPVLLDIGRAPIPYQGLALVARRSYLKQNPRTIDAVLGGLVESVAFIQNPAHREVALKSLVKNLRLSSAKEAESGYQVLQWLYSLDVKPSVTGIQNMQRLLAITNPRVAGVRAEDVVEEGPVQRLEKTSFYQDLLTHVRK
jgi:NitT/TauT family transport system substrate-binding protein